MSASRYPGFWVAPALGLTMLTTAACATAQQVAGGSSEVTAVSASTEAYAETIPGTVVELEMVSVPGGTVRMETADGPREVEVAPFWMSRVEVPWDVFDVWVYGLDEGGQVGSYKGADAVSRPSRPYVLPGENFGHQGRPALAMTYHAAQKFAEWLSEKTGKRYRLPTEAEWEFACRANAPAPETLDEYAWYWDNSDDKTHPVGTRQLNAFGLGDMLGNVSEWVAGVDGEPVVKGGAFDDVAEDVHCGARKKQTPAWNATDPQLPKSRWWLPDAPFVGFRLVREP